MTGMAILIVGIIFLIVGLYHLLIKAPKSKAQFERRSAKVEGKIIDVIVKEHKRKKKNHVGYYVSHTYKVTCLYKVSGMEYTIKNIPAALEPKVGDSLDISYNPDNPQDAHVDQYTADPETNKKAGLGIIVFAAVMCVLGLFLMR